MQIKKMYKDINPELLSDQVRDFIIKRGPGLKESKIQAYSTSLGTVHTTRGTLVFTTQSPETGAEKECVRLTIVGSAIGETKMMLDIDDGLFPPDKISGLEEDLRFIFGSYEAG